MTDDKNNDYVKFLRVVKDLGLYREAMDFMNNIKKNEKRIGMCLVPRSRDGYFYVVRKILQNLSIIS